MSDLDLDDADLGTLVAESGVRRVHILAWRDLADVEAGGSELHAATVSRLWAEAGVEVTMRTSYAQGHRPEEDRDGYHVVRRRGRYMVFPAAIVAELRGLNGPRDGLVEIWNGVPFLSPLWARGPRVTWIHHVHRQMWRMVLEGDVARAGELLETRILPPLYRRTPVVTLSQSSRRELVEEMGFHPGRVRVVPPGIDPRFRPGDVGISPRPTILGVGRLMPTKRFDELIRVAHEVRRTLPDLELTIVGEGYEMGHLRDLVTGLGAEGWVSFVGRIGDDDLVDLYRRAWVVASTSVAEGWGMTLTEAAACGTPAVATRIAGHLDSVEHGVSGLLARDHDEFVSALTTVLTDRARREELAAGARRHASRFTWDATALGTFRPLAEQRLRRRRHGRG